jgi:thiamine pyrophosphokinase
MKRTLIVANGELDAETGRRIRAVLWDKVIAVDGGALHCRELELVPQLILGDLDSLPIALREHFESTGVPFERHPAAKSETDLELALDRACVRGAGALVLTGVLGGRIDMTLTNLLLLAHPRHASVDMEIWHGCTTVRLLRPPGGEVHGQPGDTVSLIPVLGDALGVATEGLHYPLRRESLHFAHGRGVSNVLTGTCGSVHLEEGLLLMVRTEVSGC